MTEGCWCREIRQDYGRDNVYCSGGCFLDALDGGTEAATDEDYRDLHEQHVQYERDTA